MTASLATDQLRLNLRRQTFGTGGDPVIHARARYVDRDTGEPVPGQDAFPMCGIKTPASAVATDEAVTCKRCLKIIEAYPCTATFSRWRNTFPCERGGPHRTHRAIAGSVAWREGQTMQTCAGSTRTVLWQDLLDPKITVTSHTNVPLTARSRGRARPVTHYAWFFDGFEAGSGTDRRELEASIPDGIKEIRARERETGRPFAFNPELYPTHPDGADILHICW